ncbi:hypothetical protein [Streptomyces aureus]|uniref:hypothetical protein n=1 Tax=Streptomyces aureus TaxID=193461 RepID=UPI0033F01B46
MDALDRMENDPAEGARIDAIIAAVDAESASAEASQWRPGQNSTIEHFDADTTAPSQTPAPSQPEPHPHSAEVVRGIAGLAVRAGAGAEVHLTPQGELHVHIQPPRRAVWPHRHAGASHTGATSIVAAVMTGLVGALALASMLLSFTALAIGLAAAFSGGSLMLVGQSWRAQAIEARQRAQHLASPSAAATAQESLPPSPGLDAEEGFRTRIDVI